MWVIANSNRLVGEGPRMTQSDTEPALIDRFDRLDTFLIGIIVGILLMFVLVVLLDPSSASNGGVTLG